MRTGKWLFHLMLHSKSAQKLSKEEFGRTYVEHFCPWIQHLKVLRDVSCYKYKISTQTDYKRTLFYSSTKVWRDTLQLSKNHFKKLSFFLWVILRHCQILGWHGVKRQHNTRRMNCKTFRVKQSCTDLDTS